MSVAVTVSIALVTVLVRGATTLENHTVTLNEMTRRIEKLEERFDLRASREILDTPFRFAVLASKPIRQGSQWISAVDVVDPQTQRKTTLIANLSGPQDPTVSAAVKSFAQEPDLNAVNLNEVTAASKKLSKGREVLSFPNELDPQSSILLRGTTEEYDDLVKRLASALKANPRASTTEFKAKTVESLGPELKKMDFSAPHWQPSDNRPEFSAPHWQPSEEETSKMETIPMRRDDVKDWKGSAGARTPTPRPRTR